MLIAILGDIHANLPALEEVLKSIRQEKVDKTYCTGDIVGYGPYPAECIELVNDNKITVTAGNHDWAVAELIDNSFFTDEAKEVIEWTKSELTDEEKNFLQNLPLKKIDTCMDFAHSSFFHPELFEYVFETEDLIECFSNVENQIGFFGHTHFFKIYVKKGPELSDYMEIKNDRLSYDNQKVLINTGTVGQPRDGNINTGYVLLNTDKKIISIKRIPYDYNKLINQMHHRNFPKKLIERMLLGI